MTMLLLDHVSKIYSTRKGEVRALDNVSLDIGEGEFVVVRGPSGCGKTTLLLTLGGMLSPSNGRVVVNGRDIYKITKAQRAKFRAEQIGFVFQMFHLIPYLNIIENILLGSGVVKANLSREKARQMLGRLGLAERETHTPAELSAGERQRTAIARALLFNPNLILADEPTGNLDPENAAEVIGYLKEFHADGGTVVIVTHGNDADDFTDRIISLQNGKIEIGANGQRDKNTS